MVIGAVHVRLGTDSKKFRKGFKAARKDVGRLDGMFKLIKRSTLAFTATVAGLTTGFLLLAKAGIANGSMLSDISEKMGITTAKLGEYQVRAAAAGVTFKQMELGQQRMTRRIAEAAQGMGEAQTALKELNLSARDLNALSPDEQFAAIAVAMRGVTEGSDKIRLSFKLFDSEGVNLIRLLNQSTEEVADLNRKAKLLGLTLSEFETRQLDKASDSLATMKLAVTGVANQFGLALAPLIAKAEHELFDFLETAGGLDTFVAAALDTTLMKFASMAGILQEIRIRYKHLQLSLFDWLASGIDGMSDMSFAAAVLREELGGMDAGMKVRDDWIQWIKDARENMKGLEGNLKATGSAIDDLGSSTDMYITRMKELDFRTRMANGQFKAMAEGSAEALRSLGLFDDMTLDLSTSLEGLTSKQIAMVDAFKKLNDAEHLKQLKEDVQKTADVGKELGTSFQDGIGDMISSLQRGQNAMSSFKDFMRSAFSQIASSLLDSGLTTLFSSFGNTGLTPVAAGTSGGIVVGQNDLGLTPKSMVNNYYMIDARGSETEDILENKIRGVMEQEKPGIIQRSVVASREDRIREVGHP